MERYSGLKYKIHLNPYPVGKIYPELFSDPSIKKGKLSDKVIRYIIYLYDKGTGLIHEFPSDLKARKEAAAIDAGFEKVNGSWPEEIQNVMDIRDKDAYEFIMAFLRKQKHRTWTEICVTEQELHEFQSLRFASIAGVTNTDGKKKKKTAEEDKDILIAAEKKGKLLEACNQRLKHLESLYEEFFGDNKDLAEAEFTEMITPEKAERIMSTIPVPYEETKSFEDVLPNP